MHAQPHAHIDNTEIYCRYAEIIIISFFFSISRLLFVDAPEERKYTRNRGENIVRAYANDVNKDLKKIGPTNKAKKTGKDNCHTSKPNYYYYYYYHFSICVKAFYDIFTFWLCVASVLNMKTSSFSLRVMRRVSAWTIFRYIYLFEHIMCVVARYLCSMLVFVYHFRFALCANQIWCSMSHHVSNTFASAVQKIAI